MTMTLTDNWKECTTTAVTLTWTILFMTALEQKQAKTTAMAVKQKILPLQNEINPFVVVWIVPMQPQLSKTAMKGKMSKKLEVA